MNEVWSSFLVLDAFRTKPRIYFGDISRKMAECGYVPKIDPWDTEDTVMVKPAAARRKGLAVDFTAHQTPCTRSNGARMRAL